MTVHESVMVTEILDTLLPAFGRDAHRESWLLDCTLGGGGHTSYFLKKGIKVFGIDRDPVAVSEAKKRFSSEIASGQLRVENLAISDLSQKLGDIKIAGILADLGFSSDQLENRGRGFSFLKDEPLDMRMDPESGVSALEFLMEAREEELTDLIFTLGEERFSRRIARSIVEKRKFDEFPKTAAGLAHLIERSVPPNARHGRIHAATRTFQALRIHINGEMEQLDALLDGVILKLSPGGRAGIISFHSLEDRKVKHKFRKFSDQGFTIITKKPLEASDNEVKQNPRARSAKYRVIEKDE
ncbi:MAG: 16S rRNA (cytosine(1402)-N(4))-methyltransferase RsmH [Xanthomonadaceae bacterium]|nr:16S rRNA (cytosine(1402)-N(4))-methyltransferase RsmH [Xanthomonadaceae bacterium]